MLQELDSDRSTLNADPVLDALIRDGDEAIVQLAASMDWTVEETIDWLRDQLFGDHEPIVNVGVTYP